jgi:hypothetical protein
LKHSLEREWEKSLERDLRGRGRFPYGTGLNEDEEEIWAIVMTRRKVLSHVAATGVSSGKGR